MSTAELDQLALDAARDIERLDIGNESQRQARIQLIVRTALDVAKRPIEMEQMKCLADIREAVGDPTGKLMQDELVERVRQLAKQALTASVPDGWQVVPIDPTPEMLEASGTVDGWDGDEADADHINWWHMMIAAAPAATVTDDSPNLHPATADLVRRVGIALARKLARAERKYGYSDDWARSDWMDVCRDQLMQHIAKGDPLDVMAYCAFLWHHGQSTSHASPATSQPASVPSIESLTSSACRAYDRAAPHPVKPSSFATPYMMMKAVEIVVSLLRDADPTAPATDDARDAESPNCPENPDSSFSNEKLWAVHIIGPDDVIAAPSHQAAEWAASSLNTLPAANPRENATVVRAEVIEYTGSADAHMRSVVNDFGDFLPKEGA